MKILLLNPPGKKIYTRDYYCSKVSKSDYIYPPTDLLILSGILASEHEVDVLDAVAEKIDTEECLKKILDENYDAIIFLAGSVSWKEDSEFVKALKVKRKFFAIGTGDIFLEEHKKIMEENIFIDAVILDFTSDDILAYLNKDFNKIENMVFRLNGKIIDKKKGRDFQKEFKIPIPMHELFLNKNYNYPFVLKKPFALVLTDYGCPFKCNFCVMNTIGFKYRNIDDVKDEIRYIKKLGFKNIYFNDQTFGARKERLKALCQFMINEKINIGWVCWSRVDIIDKDSLSLMKKAGCHTMLFGVETSNNKILKDNNKGFTSEQVEKTFNLCKDNRIRTLGTFLFGLPGEEEKSCLNTLAFAKKIGADFASFNILVPRMNTDIRRYAIKEKWINADVNIMDQSGNFAVMGNEKMTAKKIMDLKNFANKSFYLRPSYILRRLINVRSFYELRLLIMNGLSVIRDMLKFDS